MLSDVQSMVCEVNKMQDFDHPHVMSLIGVCLDAGPGIAIVMPYMANGSLLDYLKKERSSLELDNDCEIDQVTVWRICELRLIWSLVTYTSEFKSMIQKISSSWIVTGWSRSNKEVGGAELY